MGCNPWRWLWGLIPIAMLTWLAFSWEREGIETDLRSRAEQALEAQGHSWGHVVLDGRDAVLTGVAPEDAQPYRATETVRNTWGVRVVRARTDAGVAAAEGSVGVSQAPARDDRTSQEELERTRRAAEDHERRWKAERDATAKAAVEADERKAKEERAAVEAERRKAERAKAEEDRARAAEAERAKAEEDRARAAEAERARVEEERARVAEAERQKAERAKEDEAERARAADAARAKADEERARAAEERSRTAEAERRAADEARLKAKEEREQAEADAEAQRLADEEAKRREQEQAAAETKRKADDAAAAKRKAEEDDTRRKELAARKVDDVKAAKEKAEADRCQGLMRSAMAEGVINFAKAKADLTRESYQTLDRLAGIAKACPPARINIIGHTDSEGLEERNQLLSERRANAVATYLETRGVEANRLSTVGYGESRPIATNDTPEGMQQNRRIEFNVTPAN